MPVGVAGGVRLCASAPATMIKAHPSARAATVNSRRRDVFCCRCFVLFFIRSCPVWKRLSASSEPRPAGLPCAPKSLLQLNMRIFKCLCFPLGKFHDSFHKSVDRATFWSEVSLAVARTGMSRCEERHPAAKRCREAPRQLDSVQIARRIRWGKFQSLKLRSAPPTKAPSAILHTQRRRIRSPSPAPPL